MNTVERVYRKDLLGLNATGPNCEACNSPMRDHAWVNMDENGFVVDCVFSIEPSPSFNEALTDIHQRGTDAKLAAKMWLGWQLDVLRVRLGQVEVVEWEPEPFERRLRRNQKPSRSMPVGSRLVFHEGRAFFVRDIVD